MATRARPPLRGRYLVHNPLWNAWLRTSDFLASLILRPAPISAPSRIDRLLIAVGGHIGDAVIATAVLAPLQQAMPGVEIGVLASSWNRQVFDGHARVRRVHAVDHWKLSRSGNPLSRLTTARRTERSALRELREARYDAAVDLYPYYPNSARLLRRAGIPLRVGYASGGDGPFFTNALDWAAVGHVADEHMVVLRQVAPLIVGSGLRYELGPIHPDTALAADRAMADAGIGGAYVILHAAGGSAHKDWSREGWAQVIAGLQRQGLPVVLTGAGARDRAVAGEIAAAAPNTVNFVDRLGWAEFRHVISRSRLVLCVDTVAGHLAAASDTPVVVVKTGPDDEVRWRPLGARVTVLSGTVGAPAVQAAAVGHIG